MLKLIASIALVIGLSSISSSQNRNISQFVKTKDSLTQALSRFSQQSLIPGFSVAIVNDKEVLYSKGFGKADIKMGTAFSTESINWVASISKTFVALSILKLVEQGKLTLDQPINQVLPYPIVNPHFPNIPITIRHLVTHTSTIIDDAFVPYYIGEADICIVNDSKQYDSLPAYLQPNLTYYRMGKKISLDEHIQKYTQLKASWYTDSTFLNKEPGKYFQYSNLGAAIAARIVEIKSGLTFIEFTKYIFQPLEMKQTGWNFEDVDAKLVSKIYAQNDDQKPTAVVEHPQYYMTNYPVSGLKTNAIDLSKYLIEMIRGANGQGKLLTQSSYQILFKPQLNCDGLNKTDSSIFNGKFNIATLWSVSAKGTVLHFGGNTGVYSFIYFNPKTKKGALAIANLRDNSFGEILSIVNEYEARF